MNIKYTIMNGLINLKLSLLAFAILIAFYIGKLGKKRVIGFYWSFYFGLVMPWIGLIIVVLSKKINTPIKKTHILVKILGVLLILYGSFYLLGRTKTSPNSSITDNTEITLDTGKKETKSPSQFNWFEESSDGFGRLVGGGIMTILVNKKSYEMNDYRARRNLKNIVGIWLISIGIFLLRKKKGILLDNKIIPEVNPEQ